MQKFTLDKLPKKVLARIDFQTAFLASRCIVAAEKLKLFRKLNGKQLTASEIGRLTGIKGWRREVFLAALQAIGLINKTGDRYRNSALATKYFIKERSIYWTEIYSGECIEEYTAFSRLEEMLTTGRDYETLAGIERKYYVEHMNEDKKWAEGFTNMLYHIHRPVADALARMIDLRKYHRVLDVGGGSGVMSMALARKFPKLHATVLDLKNVCNAAKKIIKDNGLSDRVKTYVGDMNKPLPDGYDVIMFCDAGNIDSDNLMRVHRSLPDGGILIIVNYFSSDNLMEPVQRLMWQLRSKNFWLTTRKQARQMVKDTGFKNVRLKKVHGESWLITGTK